LESYTYHDIETNVGLTDEDFKPDNPSYNCPPFLIVAFDSRKFI